ncbi:FKBP-type 16 kDa peptidyl-prolyl cis-trans isomerase [Raoultella terrigena]|uniref:peptidylprolyl isomerase n=1 Tax=Raoultella terrigena TaxID=577 RepID=A0A4U9D7I3_RAOTE|nr:FKBP-type 16 kDa peptidyl-prolyl cis-trans isomerase [Raoultella terrigena]
MRASRKLAQLCSFTAMDGSEMPGVIREVNGDSITVDFNHPLAGRTVHFDIEVLEVDPALEE